MKKTLFTLSLIALLSPFACSPKVTEEQPAPKQEEQPVKELPKLDQLSRADFNRAAMRLNLPLYWKYQQSEDNLLTPDKLANLLFYGQETYFQWKNEKNEFTDEFYDTYTKLVDSLKPLPENLDPAEKKRIELLYAELDQAYPVLLETKFEDSDEKTKEFINKMTKISQKIDELYELQSGATNIKNQLPQDSASQAVFRRNWGPRCQSPKYKDNPECTAIPGATTIHVDVYPHELQKEEDFCKNLDAQPNATQLLDPFSVVKINEDEKAKNKFIAVPYSEHYKEHMTQIANDLKEVAELFKDDENEKPFHDYLMAASQAFTDNNWQPADEAWVKMNAQNSKWFLRIAPDETYWEPCNRKAGFHMSFAKINPEAIQWQNKLKPIQQEMENALAKIAGKPYKARKVTFQLPDFIDIISNAGDDRDPFGATIGQSLPNWGPVANEGRGRTVVMSNLYTDPDSLAMRYQQIQSLFQNDDMKYFDNNSGPGLLATILHEATHNFGPSHEYKVKKKTDDEIFGGPLATLAEELKAQSGALWFLELLQKKNLIDQQLAEKSYADSVFWAFGQISQGLYTPEKRIKPYPQLATIQLGIMLEEKALIFDENATAANGKDKGAFKLDISKMPKTSEKIMTIIAKIKATGNKKELEKLRNKYVDSTQLPIEIISERILRIPKTSFVYQKTEN